MKYPITPDYLENAPEYLIQLQRDLERDVLSDICRRMKLSGEMTESAIHQIIALKNRGFDQSYIDKRIKETLHLSNQEIDDIYDRAIGRNQEYYDYLIKKSDITQSRFTLGRKETEFEAIRLQTKDEFKNITQSLGFMVNTAQGKQFLPIAKSYQHTLDNALMKVTSGAFDYNTAIKGAVDELTGSGLQWVDYASGWHNHIEVAARRAVMTGVSQITGRYSEALMEDLGTSLVETTAHGGARPDHAIWQGKVFKWRK